MQEKMKKVSEEFNSLNEKIKDELETKTIECMYKKDDLDKKIKDTKENIQKTKKDIKTKNGEISEKISSHLEEKFNNLNELIDEKMYMKDKKKLEKYIDKKLDYSSECMAVALFSLEEARLSFLEAVDAQMKYDEEYSD